MGQLRYSSADETQQARPKKMGRRELQSGRGAKKKDSAFWVWEIFWADDELVGDVKSWLLHFFAIKSFGENGIIAIR